MIDFNRPCLEGCGAIQILNINEYAFNDISILSIYDDCGNEYDMSKLLFSYSLDNVCWSCYMKYDEFIETTAELSQDYYLRIKISGTVGEVKIDGETHTSISTQLDSSFSFSESNPSSSLYNPYINMDCALELYQTLTELVSSVVGIGCYYFKLSPESKSRDFTFKEYALMNVEAVKQIKLVLVDNQMPSSRPEFNDFGLDWQTDWEVEVSKQTFATAFGNLAKPMEGDFIYIPMMKRMWMVNGAYEEKKDALMWNATTFKLILVKYQEKDSVELGDTEALVNSFVKNKYEDLFGDEENVGSQFDATNNDVGYLGKMYNIYESDAIRKSINLDSTEILSNSLYYRGTLISDMMYSFTGKEKSNQLEYQTKFCGENGVLSFIINPESGNLEYEFISIGNLKINIKQSKVSTTLENINSGAKIELNVGNTYFVFLRWSKQMNLAEFSCAEYIHNKNVPLYKLKPSHYRFDMDNATRIIKKYNQEMNVIDKAPFIINNFSGKLTNIKLFDEYVDDENMILQMYPTHNHLLINDTARKIVEIGGSEP